MPQRGFTLIELLLVLAMMGVLLALGLPALTDTIRNTQLRARAENVMWGLQQTRMEAVRRNLTVRYQLVDSLDVNCALSTTGPYWVSSIGSTVGACETALNPAGNTALTLLAKSDAFALNSDGGSNDGIVVTGGSSLFCFNSLGQLTATSCGGGAVVATDIDITAPAAGTCRTSTAGAGVACLRVTVRSGGQVRVCDPALNPNGTDSRRCMP